MKKRNKIISSLPHYDMPYLVEDAEDIRNEIVKQMKYNKHNLSKKNILSLIKGFLDVIIFEKESRYKNDI